VRGDASSVPAEQRVRCDEPAVATGSGECLGYRCEQSPSIIVERRPVVLAAENAELVA